MDEFDFLTASELGPIDDFLTYSTSPEFCDPVLPKNSLELTLDHTELVPGTLAYRKARKRRQNRESAARSRARKKSHLAKVEQSLSQATELNAQLSLENSELKQENAQLREELERYKSWGDTDSVKIRRTGNSKWLLASSAFTLLCLVMIVEGEAVSHTPQSSSYQLRSFTASSSSNCSLIFVFAALAVLTALIKVRESFLTTQST